MGFELVNASYVAISPRVNGGVHASALGLDIHISDEGLGIYDPVTGEWLQKHRQSQQTIRAETAETRAENR